MSTLAGGDVLGFYAALAIDLPSWGDQRYAQTRCFAAPDEHTNGDRTPSLSVSLATGRYRCWGCGARGGPYDAALACGHTPRSAINLMISHGLIEPRTGSQRSPGRAAPGPVARRPRPVPARPKLKTRESDVARWAERLRRQSAVLARLERERGWRPEAALGLGLGLDAGGRITIPIRAGCGQLRGLLRYRPWPGEGPKMLAVRGTRLGLIPHPVTEPSRHVILTEGPSDAMAARSHGLPALAVPGTDAWQPQWAQLFWGRTVTVVMDSDKVGRAAAERIHSDLDAIAEVEVVDLDPGRSDGYDLSEALLSAGRVPAALARVPALASPHHSELHLSA